MRADILAPVGLWINSSFRFSVIIRVCKNEPWLQNYSVDGFERVRGQSTNWRFAWTIRRRIKMENCLFVGINPCLDRRTRRTQAAIGTIWYYWEDYLRLFENVIFSSGFLLPSILSLCVPLSRCHYHFPRRRIAIMLILTTRFIAPFRSSASMRRMKLRKNDGKSFRLRTTLSPSITLSLIPYLRSTSRPSFFDGHT